MQYRPSAASYWSRSSATTVFGFFPLLPHASAMVVEMAPCRLTTTLPTATPCRRIAPGRNGPNRS